jgi:hypothetical protein
MVAIRSEVRAGRLSSSITWAVSSTAPDETTTVKAIRNAQRAGHQADRPGLLVRLARDRDC